MPAEREWRILLVEDEGVVAGQIREDAEAGSLLPDVGKMNVAVCGEFKDASSLLEERRVDFVVLDLKDDATRDEEAGLRVFDEIRLRRFVPVVFYSAVAHLARDLDNPFVRVVEKTEALTGLRQAFKQLYDTGLPAMLRHIEDEQRSYMWDFVAAEWAPLRSECTCTDLAHLLARRLARMLELVTARSYITSVGGQAPAPGSTGEVDPIEMYVYPPLDTPALSGCVLNGTVGSRSGLWAVLTPRCDFWHPKTANRSVVLAPCLELAKTEPYAKLSVTRSNTARGELKELLKGQKHERFYFLPRFMKLPDSVIDFSELVSVPLDAAKKMDLVAALDSPFAEDLLVRFSRYYGRLGPPDLRIEPILGRIEKELPPKGA